MDEDPKRLSTRIQMLATLVATATYAAGFNPPGGVWQDIHDAGGHLPGDPIMRPTHYRRYAVFFYCNAVAFTLSLVVVAVTLFITANLKARQPRERKKIYRGLGILMAADMVAFTVAYGAGACRTKLTIVWYIIQVPFPFFFVMHQALPCLWLQKKMKELGKKTFSLFAQQDQSNQRVVLFSQLKAEEEYLRAFQRLMVPVSMFALTITYVAGLSTPGGFWDSAEGGHRPGDAILGERFQGRTLREFLTLNTTAFLGSLYALSLLIVPVKKHRTVLFPLFCVLALVYLLIGLLGAYIVGNSRGRVNWPLYGEVFACMVVYVAVHVVFMRTAGAKVPRLRQRCAAARARQQPRSGAVAVATTEEEKQLRDSRRRRGASLVQLMAGLAMAITYQAGLYPPGGLWTANADGHTAGDPILLATNARRYRGFYYCNSVSFVASLLAMLLVQKKTFNNYHALEAAMLLDMLGLVGAYAIGSCRDQVSTLYVAGLAGAAVVYVFVHVSYFTLGDTDRGGAGGDSLQPHEVDGVENIGGRFLLFAVLVASITYQAGLTPPGGFLLKDDAQSGHHAGDPVLLYNYPRRYRAFFYCNSVSFTLSIVLILLLVNPNEYRPAIRSHALSVCSAVSYVCLMGAFAAGSTQHLTESYFIFVLAGLLSLSSLALLLLRWWKGTSEMLRELQKEDKDELKMSKIVYLMTLAILVASAAYPAGLDPPGGSWQSSSDGHDAGNPVMHDSRRQRYLAFFVGNTVSFLASLMLIVVLLFAMWWRRQGPPAHTSAPRDASAPPDPSAQVDTVEWSWSSFRKWVNSGLVSLQCLGFLVAYAAGSSRQWKASAHIGTLVGAVLLFVAVHVLLSCCRRMRAKDKQPYSQTPPVQVQGSGHGEQNNAQTAPVQDAPSDGPQEPCAQIGAREGSAHAGEGSTAVTGDQRMASGVGSLALATENGGMARSPV